MYEEILIFEFYFRGLENNGSYNSLMIIKDENGKFVLKTFTVYPQENKMTQVVELCGRSLNRCVNEFYSFTKVVDYKRLIGLENIVDI